MLLGAYKPVLEAIHSKDFFTIGILAIGAIVGLLTFSKILKWLFKKYHNLTLAILTGFILGSLNKIWPWKRVLTWRTNSQGEKVPFNEESVSPFTYGDDNNLMLAVLLAAIGFLLIILLEKVATIKK